MATAQRKICLSCYKEAKKGRYCSTCYVHKHRAADPVKYSYQSLKDNALRREKPFTITLEQFRLWSYKTDYYYKKGKKKESYTVDCIENALGYVPGNIRVLPLVDNSRKGAKALDYDWENKTAKVITLRTNEEKREWFDEGEIQKIAK